MDPTFQFKEPTIIILNGHSSSAKTSTIDILQRYSNAPIFHLSIDHFFLSLGPQYLGSKSADGFSFKSYYKNDVETQEKLRTEIHYGPKAMIACKSLAPALLYPYNNGLNVIVDDVIYYEELMENYKSVLKNTRTYFIHIYCDAEVLTERERYRFNRPLGLAIAQQELMLKQNLDYDLVINNSSMNPEQVAREIMKYINTREPRVMNN